MIFVGLGGYDHVWCWRLPWVCAMLPMRCSILVDMGHQVESRESRNRGWDSGVDCACKEGAIEATVAPSSYNHDNDAPMGSMRLN
jgi:hypothetical protein